ncbi:hypothetical protein D3C73_657360 [compost metagenome]
MVTVPFFLKRTAFVPGICTISLAVRLPVGSTPVTVIVLISLLNCVNSTFTLCVVTVVGSVLYVLAVAVGTTLLIFETVIGEVHLFPALSYAVT